MEQMFCPKCGELVAEYSEWESDGTGFAYEILVYECSNKIDYTDNWSSTDNTCNWKGYMPLTEKQRNEKFKEKL